MSESAKNDAYTVENVSCVQTVRGFPNGFVFNFKPVALTLITHFFTHPECHYENYCKVETSSKCSLSSCDTAIVKLRGITIANSKPNNNETAVCTEQEYNDELSKSDNHSNPPCTIS